MVGKDSCANAAYLDIYSKATAMAALDIISHALRSPNIFLSQKPPRSVHAPISAPTAHRKAVVAVWWQWHAGCKGKALEVLLSLSLPSALCSAHPGATTRSGLGYRRQEHSLQSKDWHTRMAGQSMFPWKGRNRAGGFWSWAGCSPCLWRNSVMTDLEQRDTEQAPGQDTNMCLGLGQGKHRAEFSGTSWGEEHVGQDSLAQTSFCDISSHECVLCATHRVCNPWIKNRLPIWDSRAIVNTKMTLHTDMSRSLHWPIAIPAHCWYWYILQMDGMS